MRMHILVSFSVALTVCFGQQTPQLCAQIDKFDACNLAARARVDQCSQNVTSVPNQAFYDCQCKELTSEEQCFWYCPDSPDIMLQLSAVTSNAQSWCNQASSMRLSQTSTTSKIPATTTISTNAPVIATTVHTTTMSSQTKSGDESTLQPSSTKNTYGPSSTLVLTGAAMKNKSFFGIMPTSVLIFLICTIVVVVQ